MQTELFLLSLITNFNGRLSHKNSAENERGERKEGLDFYLHL
jgi:hypothetical protein